MATLEERCKKFATRNYLNSDGEVVATIIDGKVYNNALAVAKTVKKETIDNACEWLKENVEKYLFNRGGFEEYIPTCGDKLYTDFKKAMEE